jgi:acyl-[acyl-carrier-protein]-phospholipid O-acyltransferase/long-chain-fatty-acid--[acyl-carrier-protein] ligase
LRLFDRLFLFTLYLFSSSLPITIISLALLGICGGAYLIPFDAFLQINSPDEKRGQVIAAANFFSFIGVLMASLALYFLSEELGFSAASGFAFMGILTLISNTVTIGRLSGLFFPFFVNKILKRFRRLKLAAPAPDPSTIIILQSNSWYDALLLFSCMPRLKILVPDQYMRRFPWFNGLVECIRIIPPEPDMRSTLKTLFGQAKRFQGQNSSVCLFFHKREDSAEIIEAYSKVFGRLKLEILFAHGTKERIPKRFFFFRYYQKQITLSFSKDE